MIAMLIQDSFLFRIATVFVLLFSPSIYAAGPAPLQTAPVQYRELEQT